MFRLHHIFSILVAVFLWVTSSSAYELNGDFVQGGLVYGKAVPGVKVYLDDRLISVSDDGHFVFGFGRDAPVKTVLRVELPGGEIRRETLQVTRREYDIQYIDGIAADKVTPPPEVLPRIREESRLIAKVRQYDHSRVDFLVGFQWPVHGVVTGVYGSQRVLNNQPRRPHYGIDIASPLGMPVKAPAPGIVTLAYPDMYFSGGTLVLDHGHGLSSSFLHLDKILVKDGDIVKQGQVIAEVGSSGRSTGAHLDWRVNWFERRLDPALLAGEMEELGSSP